MAIAYNMCVCVHVYLLVYTCMHVRVCMYVCAKGILSYDTYQLLTYKLYTSNAIYDRECPRQSMNVPQPITVYKCDVY